MVARGGMLCDYRSYPVGIAYVVYMGRYIDVIMFIVICGIISLFWLAFKVIDKILK